MLEIHERTFFERQNVIEMKNLLDRQAREIEALNEFHKADSKGAEQRRLSKANQLSENRETKLLDLKISNQEKAHKTIMESDEMLKEHQTKRMVPLTNQMEDRHEKERTKLESAQKRKMEDQKTLHHIKSLHLSEEEAGAAKKKLQSKINHQYIIDRRITDHLAERQSLEMKQLKEGLELEAKTLRDMSNLSAIQIREFQDQEVEAKNVYAAEKDRFKHCKDSIKILKSTIRNHTEIQRMMAVHSSQRIKLKKSQQEAAIKRQRKWANALVENGDENGEIRSTKHLPEAQEDAKEEGISLSNNLNESEENQSQNAILELQLSQANNQLEKLQQDLLLMVKLQKEKRQMLRKAQEADRQSHAEAHQRLLLDLEWRHDEEMQELRRVQEAKIDEILQNQKREYEIEESIQEAEFLALQERRTLNSLLDNVANGVISITPTGIIQRFKYVFEGRWEDDCCVLYSHQNWVYFFAF